jgi:hypothetical protein
VDTESPQDPRELYDSLTVIEELATAVDMTSAGMRALVPADGRRAELDTTLQHLASGFERFAKLTYIEARRHATGSRPSGSELRRHGHDVLGLLDDLVEVVASCESYAARPPVRDDLEFIRTDRDLRDLIGVLSHFGQRGRYSRIDGLVSAEGGDVESEPSRQWDEIELRLLMALPDWEEVIGSAGAEQVGAREVVARLQRLARALARMWVWGALGKDGSIHTGMLYAFVTLKDEELGSVA